ncbi:MAG: efflux RND transporter periplasmic adaptor subunit, partial [Salibacteraceae bacterium]|nr:efflux RND transporter periplasmic adaptor subunit [Salibacteraceae bacterium]
AMRKAGIWNANITDMVAEGTIVDSGDYIATLDRTEIADKVKTLYNDLEKVESQYLSQKLDTSLTLRQTRDELVNLRYAMEEKKLISDQSIYEAPAVQRQAEIDMEKAKRAFDQAVENYKLKVEQAEAKTNEVFATYSQTKNSFEFAQNLLGEFTINAPKSGMLIYHRDWDGTKVQVGSRVGAWDPVVATLPDLTKMVSVTYVNEVDISKVHPGQTVKMGIDAFPDKEFDGVITAVANVGEQMPNTDAKVFEVTIELNESDSILRPAMTTSNQIFVAKYDNVNYLPIEAVYSFENMKAVYIEAVGGLKLQEVNTGASNDNFIIIEDGLNLGDEVLIIPTIAEKVTDTLRLAPATAISENK